MYPPFLRAMVVLALLTAALSSPTGSTGRVSLGPNGIQASGDSYEADISGDGRFVVFQSVANNLVEDESNGAGAIFVHDRHTDQTVRVSVSSSGAQADNESYTPVISDDGRFVAFGSTAVSLVPGDTRGADDIFVHDLSTGQTERVSVSSGGLEANGGSYDPAISADGRFVAFWSIANNLVAGDTNVQGDIFVRDRLMGTTERVSITTDGTQVNGYTGYPAISADGRFVGFVSAAQNLMTGDGIKYQNVFVHDRQTGTTEQVSTGLNGAQPTSPSTELSLSADGRFVSFTSYASNLVAGDTNNQPDIFVRDRLAGVTERVSQNGNGEQANGESIFSDISADGRFVAFGSQASNLVEGDTNDQRDIFVYDRQENRQERVSLASDGSQADLNTIAHAISADGCFVTFVSNAKNLVPGDSNDRSDVFVHARCQKERNFLPLVD